MSARLLVGADQDVALAGRRAAPGQGAARRADHGRGLLRDQLFGERTVVLTSATLELGGTFDAAARTARPGRRRTRRSGPGSTSAARSTTRSRRCCTSRSTCRRPAGTGSAAAQLDELEALVRAAGGRTLGLFSSMRAARTAAEAMRERLDDAGAAARARTRPPTLVGTSPRDAPTSLFGTLSLWQGVDVPGPACQLVVIDRVPFPRPDDPLSSARSQAVADAGRQRLHDRGRDPRGAAAGPGLGPADPLARPTAVSSPCWTRGSSTARYAGFLRASLPPFWPTTDRALVLAALARLDAAAGPEVWPVDEPGSRAAGGSGVGRSAWWRGPAAPAGPGRGVAPHRGDAGPRLDRGPGRGAARRRRDRLQPGGARRAARARPRGWSPPGCPVSGLTRSRRD